MSDIAMRTPIDAHGRGRRRDLRAYLDRMSTLYTPRHRLALWGVLLVAAFCALYNLARVGYGNLYYAAAVKSMLESWHNFFFVSFDPGGFVTVDKPPLGFWIQAASAKVFGFSGFSLLLPEAIAGVLSVAVLYHLVARAFGLVPGLLAALVLAIMPISVVTSRDNTIDSLLVLTSLLAAWAVLKATEAGSLRWLLVCAALVGLGFNIKMLEAYLVVPAFGLLYLLGAPARWRVRIGHLALAGALMLGVSLAWVVAVDATPASARPYVGSSRTNSELELAFGYNGLERLTGRIFGGGGGQAAQGRVAGEANGAPDARDPQRDDAQGSGFRGGGGFGGETGAPGPLRLLNEQLGAQVSWLLPLALLGLLASGWALRPRALLARLRAQGDRACQAFARLRGGSLSGAEPGLAGRLRALRDAFRAEGTAEGEATVEGAAMAGAAGPPWGDRRQHAFLLWGMWFLTQAIFFSVAGFFHAYYLVMLAPSIAALAGIGAVLLWRDLGRADWRGWLLPLALVVTAVVQAILLAAYPDYARWLTPLVLVVCLVSAALLVRNHPSVARAIRGAPGLEGLERSPLAPQGAAGAAEPEGAWAVIPDERPPATAAPRWAAWPGASWLAAPAAGALGRALTAVCLAALLLAPATWVAASLAQSGGGALLHAGPAGTGGGFPGGFGGGAPRTGAPSAQQAAREVGDNPFRVNAGLLAYLQAHKDSARYLFATTNANGAAPYILATGEPVMAMGGFAGGDPILTPASLARLVADGQVRYFLLEGGRGGARQLPPGLLEDLPPQIREILEEGGGFPGGFGGAGTGATAWVTGHCAVVPASAWGGGASGGQGFGGLGGGGQLYDCGASAAR